MVNEFFWLGTEGALSAVTDSVCLRKVERLFPLISLSHYGAVCNFGLLLRSQQSIYSVLRAPYSVGRYDL